MIPRQSGSLKYSRILLLLFISNAVSGFSPPSGFCRLEKSVSHQVMPEQPSHLPHAKRCARSRLCSTRVNPTHLWMAMDPITPVLLRGGAMGAVAINLSREAFKLQSMDTYSTITALLMNASLRLYTTTKFTRGPPSTNSDGSQKISVLPREYAFTALTTLCILSGIFTVLLFNTMGICRYVCKRSGGGYEYMRWSMYVFCERYLINYFLSISYPAKSPWAWPTTPGT